MPLGAKCCVPYCDTNKKTYSKLSEPITFHNFPELPKVAVNWIKQINVALKTAETGIWKADRVWYPPANSVICSKHFLETDFKENCDYLKDGVLPTVFGHKFIGIVNDKDEEEVDPTSLVQDAARSSPVIVKVSTPIVTPIVSNKLDVFGMPSVLRSVSPQKTSPAISQSETVTTSSCNSFLGSLQQKNRALTGKLVDSLKNMPTVSPKVQQVPNTSKRKKTSKKKSAPHKRTTQKADDLIEIGPSTFLKINSDIIKVNKKETPAGNTVLQFMMDRKLSNLCGDLSLVNSLSTDSKKSTSKMAPVSKTLDDKADVPRNDDAVSLSGDEPQLDDCNIPSDSISGASKTPLTTDNKRVSVVGNSPADGQYKKGNSAISMPTVHYPTYAAKLKTKLRQKMRTITSLNKKLENMTKKMEELEDRCIVQEKNLSPSFIKKLKTIGKNASKGEPRAKYILEQVRGYCSYVSGMRWSETTLTQCGIWCRKAPYAYEYFRKSDFFKLPSAKTVRAFMKKHPEIQFVRKKTMNSNPNDSDSSSDFTFEESDQDKEVLERVNGVESGTSTAVPLIKNVNCVSEPMDETSTAVSSIPHQNPAAETSCLAVTEYPQQILACPVSVDRTGVEVQEVVLSSGQIVQCYASNISGGENAGQYYIIPNIGTEIPKIEQQYVVQSTESLPVVVQSVINGAIGHNQEVFLKNS